MGANSSKAVAEPDYKFEIKDIFTPFTLTLGGRITHKLKSLHKDEQEELKTLFAVYNEAHLLDRFTGITSQQREQREATRTQAKRFFANVKHKEPQRRDGRKSGFPIEELRQGRATINELRQGRAIIDNPLLRAKNYRIVCHILEGEEFWRFIEPYANQKKLQDIKSKLHFLPLAYYQTDALLYLATVLIPIIEKKVKRYREELKTWRHKKNKKLPFYQNYERYLRKLDQKVKKQKELILDSLLARFDIASIMAQHTGHFNYDDIIHKACADIVACLERTPTDKHIKKTLIPIYKIASGSHRQGLTASTFTQAHQYLRDVTSPEPDSAFTKRCQVTLLNAIGNINRLGATEIRHQYNTWTVVPKALRKFIPRSKGWPAWLFKGQRLRYHFFHDNLHTLAGIQARVQYLKNVMRSQEQESDWDATLLPEDIMTAFNHANDYFFKIKQDIQQQRFGKLNRLFRRRTNQFLSAWEGEVDTSWQAIITLQIKFIEQQIIQIDLANRATAQHYFAELPSIRKLEQLINNTIQLLPKLTGNHTELSAKLTQLKAQFDNATNARRYFLTHYQPILSYEKHNSISDILSAAPCKNIEHARQFLAYIKILDHGKNPSLMKAIRFVGDLLENKGQINLPSAQQIKQQIKPLFPDNSTTHTIVTIDDFITFLQQKIIDPFNEIVDKRRHYALFFMQEILKLTTQEYSRSIGGKTTLSIQLNDIHTGESHLPVTLDNIKVAVALIKDSPNPKDTSKFKECLEDYVKTYTGEDDIFHHIITTFNDPAIIEKYGDKRFKYCIEQQQYNAITHHPFFHTNKNTLLKVTQPYLSTYIRQNFGIKVSLIPIIVNFAALEDQQAYRLRFLEYSLSPERLKTNFYMTYRKQINPFLQCTSFEELNKHYGKRLPIVIARIRNFLAEYPQKPNPILLEVIHGYFSDELIQKYELHKLATTCKTLYEQHVQSLKTTGDAAPWIRRFDDILPTTNVRSRQEKMRALAASINMKQLGYERQSEHNDAIAPELAKLVEHILKKLIHMITESDIDSAVFVTIAHLYENFINKLNFPEAIKNQFTMLIDNKYVLYKNRKLMRPAILFKFEQGIDDIVQERKGLSVDINPLIRMLISHLPQEKAKALKIHVKRASRCFDENNPLHTVILALIKIIKHQALSDSEEALLTHFNHFKTLVNQIICLIYANTAHSEDYAIKEDIITNLEKSGYFSEKYAQFWQQQIDKIIAQGNAQHAKALILRIGTEQQKQSLTQTRTARLKPTTRSVKGKEPQGYENDIDDFAMDAKRCLLRDKYIHGQPMSLSEIRIMHECYVYHQAAYRQGEPAKEIEKFYTDALALIESYAKGTHHHIDKMALITLTNRCLLLLQQKKTSIQANLFIEKMLQQYLHHSLCRNADFIPNNVLMDKLSLEDFLQTVGNETHKTLLMCFQQESMPDESTLSPAVTQQWHINILKVTRSLINSIIMQHLQTHTPAYTEQYIANFKQCRKHGIAIKKNPAKTTSSSRLLGWLPSHSKKTVDDGSDPIMDLAIELHALHGYLKSCSATKNNALVTDLGQRIKKIRQTVKRLQDKDDLRYELLLVTLSARNLMRTHQLQSLSPTNAVPS